MTPENDAAFAALIARNRYLQAMLFATYESVERAAREGDVIDQGVIDDAKLIAAENCQVSRGDCRAGREAGRRELSRSPIPEDYAEMHVGGVLKIASDAQQALVNLTARVVAQAFYESRLEPEV